MAACTFALSPSSAKVEVCKRRILRLSSSSPARSRNACGREQSGIESAGGFGTKGLTGKLKAWGNGLWKRSPAPVTGGYMALFERELQGMPARWAQFVAQGRVRHSQWRSIQVEIAWLFLRRFVLRHIIASAAAHGSDGSIGHVEGDATWTPRTNLVLVPGLLCTRRCGRRRSQRSATSPRSRWPTTRAMTHGRHRQSRSWPRRRSASPSPASPWAATSPTRSSARRRSG